MLCRFPPKCISAFMPKVIYHACSIFISLCFRFHHTIMLLRNKFLMRVFFLLLISLPFFLRIYCLCF
uniref:Uncharacterized protein n=1 Tax=Hordeum vulgare subsp. vulgare TaxID=112509 RepID=A0A8I6YJ89_HORVV